VRRALDLLIDAEPSVLPPSDVEIAEYGRAQGPDAGEVGSEDLLVPDQAGETRGPSPLLKTMTSLFRPFHRLKLLDVHEVLLTHPAGVGATGHAATDCQIR